MTQLEKARLNEVERRLLKAKHLLEAIMPVHVQVDRRRKHLELEINHLSDELAKLKQGQFVMGF